MSKTNYGDEYAREATRVVFDEIKYAIACTYNFYAFPIIRSLTPKS